MVFGISDSDCPWSYDKCQDYKTISLQNFLAVKFRENGYFIPPSEWDFRLPELSQYPALDR